MDVLLVRGDSTAGLKRGDDTIAAALKRTGVSVAEVTSRYPVTRLLRATRVAAHIGVTPDLTESFDARRAASAALRAFDPTCIIFTPGFTSLLQPSASLRMSAVRFDSPPARSRTGRRGASLLRALERRAFRSTQMLLPWGASASPELLAELPDGVPVVSLPIPIRRPDQDRERSPVAVAYASSNPHKKGIDLVLEAWRLAAPTDTRLAIAGIDPEAGLRWCRRHRVKVPDTVDWVGRLAPEEWLRLLQTSEFFVVGSRYDDHPISQLEALAQGAILITVPSGGASEQLSLARALPGRLVAEHIAPEPLADVLRRGLALSDEARRAYRETAKELMAPYSEATLDERLRDQVLPQLLGNGHAVR